MVASMYFNQDCPVCGRGLQIAIELLGQPVACRHCGGTFVASHQSRQHDSTADNAGLVQRANRLLALATNYLHSSGASQTADGYYRHVPKSPWFRN